MTLARLNDVATGTGRRCAQAEFTTSGRSALGAGGLVGVQIDVVHVVRGEIGGNVNVIGVVQNVGESNDGGDVATGIDASLSIANGEKGLNRVRL